MQITFFDGLPAHILLVHVAVILVPAAALLTVLRVVWLEARKRSGIIAPIAALVALGTVIVTINAGQWLLTKVNSTPLIRVHALLGPTLLPWAIVLAVLSVGEWVWFSFVRDRMPPKTARIVTIALAVVSIAVAAITIYTVVQIGVSGSRAVWTGVVSQ